MPTIPAQEFDHAQIPELVFSAGDATMKSVGGQKPLYSRVTVGAQASLTWKNELGYSRGAFISASETTFRVENGNGADVTPSPFYSYTYDNKTVYYYYVSATGSLGTPEILEPTPVNILSGNNSLSYERVAWLMVYGGYTGKQITYNLTNCTGNPDNPTTFQDDTPFFVEFTPDAGYEFHPGVTSEIVAIPAAVEIQEHTAQTLVAKITPLLNPSNITVFVRIANVIYNLTGCHKTDGPDFLSPGDHFSFSLEADTGMQFVSGSVSVTGASPDGWEYVSEGGYSAEYKMDADAEYVIITVNLEADPYSGLDGEGGLPTGTGATEPTMPTLSATTSGIIGLFTPNIQQMQDLADFMWTDFGGTGTTTEDILKEVVQALKRIISNPLQYVLGLNIIPSQGLSIGSSKLVRFGFVSSGVYMSSLASQFFVVDCGSISFPPVRGDTFLDYAPYAKFSIYLPYIGFRELDANDCVGHTISVKYHGDAATGAITAYIFKDSQVFYQFAGCCALTVPLSSDSWAATVASAAQAATAIIKGFNGAAAGGYTFGGSVTKGLNAGAAQAASSVASNPSLLSPQVAHSGSMGGASGLMGVQTPFIIREAVSFHSTEGFNTVSGYPSYYYRKLDDLAGYTVMLDIHLHDIPALVEEIDEIESLLKGGVYL